MEGSRVCEVQSESNLVDRISQLPNEVLVDILTLLTLKEVGRSSLLSKRWRDLWKYTTRLNFDVSEVLYQIEYIADEEIQNRRKDLEKSKFLTWVNQVVTLHECPSVDEFRVKFDLDSSYANYIDEWIKFMIRKRAKRIELDLSGYRVEKIYSLSKECCDYIRSVSNLPNLMNLRSLCLDYVNVGGELVEYLLSKCHFLETLSVRTSMTLGDLKVVGPSLLLKYLEIHSCAGIQRIELCAPKLERFIYFGGEVKFDVGSNPNLIELDMGGAYEEKVTYVLDSFGSFLSQLETLTLRMFFDMISDVELPKFGELSNLKHLTLEFELDFDRVLTSFTKLIAAAPVLAKFTMMLVPPYRPFPNLRGKNDVLIQPHGCLKEVEIIGFQGGVADFEMARYMVKNAINLEKMVIIPVHQIDANALSWLEVQERLARIESHVKELKEGLAPRAELTVVVDMEEEL